MGSNCLIVDMVTKVNCQAHRVQLSFARIRRQYMMRLVMKIRYLEKWDTVMYIFDLIARGALMYYPPRYGVSFCSKRTLLFHLSPDLILYKQ